MIDLYFYSHIGNPSSILHSRPEKEIEGFEINSLVEFKNLIQEYLNDFTHIKPSSTVQRDLYINTHGHHQIDLISIHPNRLGTTFIFDNTSNYCFYVEWDEIGWNSFSDIQHYPVYFPPHMENVGYLPMEGIHCNVTSADLFEQVINKDRTMHLYFSIKEELSSNAKSIPFVMELSYLNGENPFLFESWSLKNHSFYHVQYENNGYDCFLCGQHIPSLKTGKRSISCPHFDFYHRKESVVSRFLNFNLNGLMKQTINDFIKINQVNDVWRIKQTTNNFVAVKLFNFEKDSPFIDIQFVMNNHAYLLKDIQWKKKKPDDSKDFFKLGNWDYMNATIIHMDPYGRVGLLDKFQFDDTCFHCKKMNSMNKMDFDRICSPLDQKNALKKNVFSEFLRTAKVEDFEFITYQYWCEFL